jgi:hypothetical protein
MKGRRYVNMCYAASPYTGVVKEFYRVSGSLANARTPMEELFVQVINQNPSLEVVRSMVPLESAKTFLERVTSKGWLTTAGEPGGEFWYVDRSKVPKPLNLEETQLRATEVGVLEQKVAVKPGDRRRNTN